MLMIRVSPGRLILLGFVLVLLGFVLPLLMIISVLQPTFLLSFFAFTASLSGLFLGMIGAAMYVRIHRGR